MRGSADFALASKRFGTPIVVATVFATWFGAESVLGIPATFLKEGLRGLVADPFSAVVCLALVAAVFARPFFRFDGLTLGDYFRKRFGRTAEILLSACIAFSYIGWIAAQLVALGLAMKVLSGGCDRHAGRHPHRRDGGPHLYDGGRDVVGLAHGFLQAIVIAAGLFYVAWVVVDQAGGMDRVVAAASQSDRLRFLPEPGARSVLAWLTASLIIVFGSVPQQDVLQRVMSSKDEATAVRSTFLGGIVYFCIASLPIVLVSAALVIDGPMVARLVDDDSQL